jgi:transcriptional regulator with XRE-family HTH domain
MKASPGTGEVNPLQRMLGTFLRLERARLGYSTKDVADRLGLNDTYYRLAESGRAALNQSLVFKIIEVFAASDVPTHDIRSISFNRFALYMVGTHWVGAEMALQPAKGQAGRHAVEALASLVSEFHIFYEQTKGYFDLEEGDEQRRFLESIAAPAVGVFLRSEIYGTSEKEFLQVGDLPTLNIDILLDLKRSLTDRSFVHSQKIAARWESEKASQFYKYRAIFLKPDLILNQENLDLFHYEYLGQKRFKEGHFIFVNSNLDEDKLKDEFVKMQNVGRRKKNDINLQDMTQYEIDKMRIVCIDEKHRKLYDDKMISILNKHEAYWSFETHFGLQISFLGLQDHNVENVRNLNLTDSDDKAKEFDELWKNINATRSN